MSFRLDGFPERIYGDPPQDKAIDRAFERLERNAARLATGLERARRRKEEADKRAAERGENA